MSGNLALLAPLFPQKKWWDSVLIGFTSHSTQHRPHHSIEPLHFFLKTSGDVECVSCGHRNLQTRWTCKCEVCVKWTENTHKHVGRCLLEELFPCHSSTCADRDCVVDVALWSPYERVWKSWIVWSVCTMLLGHTRYQETIKGNYTVDGVVTPGHQNLWGSTPKQKKKKKILATLTKVVVLLERGLDLLWKNNEKHKIT